MTLKQKIEWVKDLLSGEHSLRNRSDFYIPAQDIPDYIAGHFWEILEKFEREGLVKEAYLGYAGLFDAEHQPEVFERIGEDGKPPVTNIDFFEAPKKGEKNPETAILKGKYKSQTVELLPTYYIEIDAAKLNGSKPQSSKEDVEFDALNGVISFGKISHTFQENNREKLRLRLFKALWKDRKVIKKGKTKPSGMPIPPGTVAVKMELVTSNRDFDRNQQLREKLSELIKNVKTTLRRKKLPITIRKTGGIQIVVEIK